MMKIEDQVCTLSQAKLLKEMKVPQESFMWYCAEKEDESDMELVAAQGYSWGDFPGYNSYPIKYSAFSVAELGEMLQGGSNMVTRLPDQSWKAEYEKFYSYHPYEAEARAAMLINAIDKGLIKF